MTAEPSFLGVQATSNTMSLLLKLTLITNGIWSIHAVVWQRFIHVRATTLINKQDM